MELAETVERKGGLGLTLYLQEVVAKRELQRMALEMMVRSC